MLLTVALALAVAHTAESPERCARVAEQASAIRALLEQRWWTLNRDAVAKDWPQSLDRVGCGSVEGTCAELVGGDGCPVVFLFTAERKGAPFSLDSFSLTPSFASLIDATKAADGLWASVPFPADACPGSLGSWGQAELSRACAWFADGAKFDVDIHIDTMEGGYDLRFTVMRGHRK